MEFRLKLCLFGEKNNVPLILHHQMSKVALWMPRATQYFIEIQIKVFINKSKRLGKLQWLSFYSWPLSHKWHLDPLWISERVKAVHTQRSLSAKCICASHKACSHTLTDMFGVCWRWLTSTFWSQWDLIVFYPVAAYSNIFTMRAIVSTPHTMFTFSKEFSLPSHSTSSSRISPAPSPNAPAGATSAPPLRGHTHTYDKFPIT